MICLNKKEIAFLIGIALPKDNKWEVINSLNELDLLTNTLDIEVFQKVVQTRHNIDNRYFIGKGKLEELKEIIEENHIDLLIVDSELNPVQIRNIENILNVRTITRTDLIVEIFARRAKTKEAKLQVELAQLTLALPSLRRKWTHLGRIEGGIGIKGPGEKQIELDRRQIKKRIVTIKKKLTKFENQLNQRRKNRTGKHRVSLVGYTNAGKSSLLSLLSGKDVYATNKLFSTLDSKIGEVYINDELKILLSDTVGFIRQLPHQLVASFKSTLKEVSDTELLLHVIDVSEDDLHKRIESVNSVLSEIDAGNTPMIYVFNKTDKLESMDTNRLAGLSERYSNSCFISTKTKSGIEDLKLIIQKHFMKNNKVEQKIN